MADGSTSEALGEHTAKLNLDSQEAVENLEEVRDKAAEAREAVEELEAALDRMGAEGHGRDPSTSSRPWTGRGGVNLRPGRPPTPWGEVHCFRGQTLSSATDGNHEVHPCS